MVTLSSRDDVMVTLSSRGDVMVIYAVEMMLW